jgi:protease I
VRPDRFYRNFISSGPSRIDPLWEILSGERELTGRKDMFESNNRDILKVAPIPDRLKKNQRVAIITGDDVEDLEFFYPYYRLTEAGYEVAVITAKGGAFKGKHGLELKDSLAIDSVDPANYVLLYLPGGKAPAELRKNEKVLAFVKRFAEKGKPIAALCHGPQVLISADLVRGKQIAAWPGIREEVEKAGATFIDEALVEDGAFITGRMPGDLHRHLYGVIKALEGLRLAKEEDRRSAA